MEDVGVALNFLRARKAAASGMKVIHAWSAEWWDLKVCTKSSGFSSQGILAWGRGELQGNLGSRKDLGVAVAVSSFSFQWLQVRRVGEELKM